MKRMVAALLLLLLCACTAQVADVAPAPESPPAESSEITPAAPEPDPLPDEVPEPEPLPDEASEPAPEPVPYPFTEGPALSVDGAEAGAIALLEQAYYLPLEALTAHLPIHTEPTDDGGLARYAVLTPRCDLSDLRDLYIITDFDVIE